MGKRPTISMPPLPAPPPDYADQAVREAELSARVKGSGKTGRKGTFLTGPQGVTSAAPIVPKKLLGQ